MKDSRKVGFGDLLPADIGYILKQNFGEERKRKERCEDDK